MNTEAYRHFGRSKRGLLETWSIKVRGIVQAYSTDVLLTDAHFKIIQHEVKRSRALGRKKVFATVIGEREPTPILRYEPVTNKHGATRNPAIVKAPDPPAIKGWREVWVTIDRAEFFYRDTGEAITARDRFESVYLNKRGQCWVTGRNTE